MNQTYTFLNRSHRGGSNKNGDRVSRVLMVTGQSGGGIWHYACALSKALTDEGVDVALAAPYPFESDVVDGLPVWPLGSQNSDGTRSPSLRWHRAAGHLQKLRQLRQLLLDFHPDIVHFHDRFGLFDFLYLDLLKRLGPRIVYTAHDVRSLFGKTTWFDRARYRAADAIFVHSSNGVADLLEGGIDQSRIVRVPHANYYHLRDRSATQCRRDYPDLGIPSGARPILFFGSIAPYKGLSLLIEAFSLLLRDDPSVYLVIAGRPKDDFEVYNRQIHRLKLEEHVVADLRYIPFEEFGRFFLAANVVVLPYQRIYQSGILQLAYAFGRPVVVTNVGGLGEMVAEDRTGLVAETNDTVGLASAIRHLLTEHANAEEMGNRARRLATTKYSWAAVARKVAEIYQALQAERRHASC
ncbi:MAG TPA: glycosyltransferase family 4 protein [bacterium]|nr:glycosyltransferase family 4 protein [bacterium]